MSAQSTYTKIISENSIRLHIAAYRDLGVRLILSILREPAAISRLLLERSNLLKPVDTGSLISSGYTNVQLSDSHWEADVLPLNYTR